MSTTLLLTVLKLLLCISHFLAIFVDKIGIILLVQLVSEMGEIIHWQVSS